MRPLIPSGEGVLKGGICEDVVKIIPGKNPSQSTLVTACNILGPARLLRNLWTGSGEYSWLILGAVGRCIHWHQDSPDTETEYTI